MHTYFESQEISKNSSLRYRACFLDNFFKDCWGELIRIFQEYFVIDKNYFIVSKMSWFKGRQNILSLAIS